MKRQRRVWVILRYLVTLYELYRSRNFYEYRENLSSHKEASSFAIEEDLTPSDFDIAFRFCDFKFYKGECEGNLTSDVREKVRQQKFDNIQYTEILDNVIDTYKEYWDDVLASYKKTSARRNRVQYLIEKLDEYKTWPELQESAEVINKINILQEYYLAMAELE